MKSASSTNAATILNPLEKLVNIDAASFGPGHATRTGLDPMSVFVVRRTKDRLAILGMRSLAVSLWQAIGTVAERLEGVLE